MGIRRQLVERLNQISSTSLEEAYRNKMQYIRALRMRPIAIETATANEQHYEVGTGVLEACLGPRMKYSCCLYPTGAETLAQAEMAMLELYVQRADLKDGMSILDLGYVHKQPIRLDLPSVLTRVQLWLGLGRVVLCRDLSQFKGHGILKLKNTESVH